VRLVLLVLGATLLMPGAALAHVKIKPERAPAGGEARLIFEVPNERPDAATRRIVIQMPPGVTSVEGRLRRGWRLTVRRANGAVRRVTVATRGRGLTGDQRGRFRLVVGLPRREGATLTFKVLQVYDSGEILRWIGPEGVSEPAPTLRLTAAREQPSPTESPPAETGAPPAGGESSDDGDGGGGGDVPIWAGIGLMLLAAFAGTTLARRRNRRRLERYRGEDS
jgi:uncharacterized protein YcnI